MSSSREPAMPKAEVTTPLKQHVHPVGRVEELDSGQLRFSWPGTGFTLRFQGTGVAVTLDDHAQYFTVLVDGKLEPRFETHPGERRYVVVSGLPQGEHYLELYRRTEALEGVTRLLSVEVENGAPLPPKLPMRHLEFIGDSITCGYGDEGPDCNCHYSADTSNQYMSYAALTARALEAEAQFTAWSGKGVVFNYGDGPESKLEPLPALFDRTIPNDPASRWSFTLKPDAVVVNLGTNDFSTLSDPSEVEFLAGYRVFLSKLRSVYPEAHLFLGVGPMLPEDDRLLVEGYIQRLIEERRMVNDTKVHAVDLSVEPQGYGCDYHPNLATHRALAEKLEAQMRKVLGW